MDERMKRLWVAAEARALGRGGPALVERATGIRGKRIYAGLRDLDEIERAPESPIAGASLRRPGAGRLRSPRHIRTSLRISSRWSIR
jgi:hypothetical protein